MPAETLRRFWTMLAHVQGGTLNAAQLSRGLAPKLDKGFHHAREDINPERSFVVYSGNDRYPKSEGIEVIGLGEVFEPLKDPKIFQSFSINDELKTIVWPTGADLAPEFLYKQAVA